MLESITKALETKPRVDLALSALDKHRLRLPLFIPSRYFPDFAERGVVFYEVPRGAWSSPVADVLFLAKIIACARPKRLLEIGSFRGYTALAMARHMPEDASLVTVDRNEQHGEAYRDSEFASRIERRVGTVEAQLFQADPDGGFDLIFLDAGHRFEEVKHDTEILERVLAPEGFLVWHDYSNWGKFNRFNGVPEFLHEFGKRHRVARIDGSGMAIYSPMWDKPAGQKHFEAATIAASAEEVADPWGAEGAR
jgi:predicted O-methyltransferase YrrM